MLLPQQEGSDSTGRGGHGVSPRCDLEARSPVRLSCRPCVSSPGRPYLTAARAELSAVISAETAALRYPPLCFLHWAPAVCQGCLEVFPRPQSLRLGAWGQKGPETLVTRPGRQSRGSQARPPRPHLRPSVARQVGKKESEHTHVCCSF